LTDEQPTHFVIYLNKETFVGEAGAKLAETLRRLMNAGLYEQGRCVALGDSSRLAYPRAGDANCATPSAAPLTKDMTVCRVCL
jgi:hypothetical protein